MRRALLALLAALALLGAAGLPAAARGQGGEPTPTLRLLDQPIAVSPDGRFTVLVGARDAPTATEIAVDIYDKVQPGEAIGPEPEGGPAATFDVVPLSAPNAEGLRAAGFTISLSTSGEPNPDPVWGRRIDEPGVYPVRIRLRDADGNEQASMMTSLIRLPGPDDEVVPARAAVLVDVHHAPPADPDDRDATDEADAALLRRLAPVLDSLAAHPDLPATFDVTPDALARIAGDPDAAESLAALRAQLEGADRNVLTSPYVDLDPTSLVGNGLASELSHQQELGNQTLRELLEPPVAHTWSVGTGVDGPTLDALRAAGIDRLLLPSPTVSGTTATSGGAVVATPQGSSQVLPVSPAFALGASAPDDPVLDAHQLLARLAQASVEAPTDGPTPPAAVVDVDPATADEASLRIVGDALSVGSPFFSATTVDALLDAEAAGTATTKAAAPAPLGAYPAAVRSSRSALTSYEAMVAGANELVAPYERTLAISAADDLDLAQRKEDASSVEAALQTPFSSVTIPAQDKVTLGARVARFPLPIESSLDHPVKVVIELESSSRLEFPSNRIEATLQPGRQVIPIQVRSRTTGDTPVKITVRSPDDGVTLAEANYTIRSTAVSGVGVVLTVGAAGYLAVWWGRHWRRNRGTARHARRRRRRPSDV